MSYGESSLAKLVRTPAPVNKDAARVAFFGGDHFEPNPRESANRTHTWRHPPVVIGYPPEGEPDWAGHSCGRMTARYWYRPGRSGNPAVWIARCTCGNYEARVPERWDQFLTWEWKDRDCCEVCKDTAVATRTARVRPSKKALRDQWLASMLDLGLTRDEVVSIVVFGINTKAVTVAEIRHAIAQAVANEARA